MPQLVFRSHGMRSCDLHPGKMTTPWKSHSTPRLLICLSGLVSTTPRYRACLASCGKQGPHRLPHAKLSPRQYNGTPSNGQPRSGVALDMVELLAPHRMRRWSGRHVESVPRPYHRLSSNAQRGAQLTYIAGGKLHSLSHYRLFSTCREDSAYDAYDAGPCLQRCGITRQRASPCRSEQLTRTTASVAHDDRVCGTVSVSVCSARCTIYDTEPRSSLSAALSSRSLPGLYGHCVHGLSCIQS